jgi:hypothetical protein
MCVCVCVCVGFVMCGCVYVWVWLCVCVCVGFLVCGCVYVCVCVCVVCLCVWCVYGLCVCVCVCVCVVWLCEICVVCVRCVCVCVQCNWRIPRKPSSLPCLRIEYRWERKAICARGEGHVLTSSVKLAANFRRTHTIVCGRGSSVSIVTGYGFDRPLIESRWGEIFRTCPDRPWGSPSILYNRYRVFPGGKDRPGRDADPWTPSNVVGHKRVEPYFYSPYGPYGLYRASVPVQYIYTSTPPMGRTACTEPQCLYSRAIPLLPLWAVRLVQSLGACTVELYLYSPYGPYGLYRASVPVQRWPLPFNSTQ